jgi:hypothetical protein
MYSAKASASFMPHQLKVYVTLYLLYLALWCRINRSCFCFVYIFCHLAQRQSSTTYEQTEIKSHDNDENEEEENMAVQSKCHSLYLFQHRFFN